jgi:hypothetical protein
MRPRTKPRPVRADGFRSSLEQKIAADLTSRGISFEYESLRVPYMGKPKKYLIDFQLPNGIIVEAKGWFTSEDRTKSLLVREQNPGIDLRFVFQRASSRLRKGSSTTYAEWCEKHGFLWAEGTVPQRWLSE